MRRLLALNQFANPPDAPGGTRLVELAERLDGWDTTIVAARRNLFTRQTTARSRAGFVAVPTTPYQDNGASRIVNWASYAVVATAVGLTRSRPDVVLASSPHLLTGLAGWIVARVRRVPFVLEVRDLWPQILADTGRLDPSSTVYRAVKRLEQFLYAHSDRIVVLAQGVGDAIAAEGVPADRIALIPNGADPDDFVVATSRDELRSRLGFEGTVFLYAGAHGPANGLDFVLDAARATADTDAQWVLVGDGITKAALVARARRERLANVRFLDPVPKATMPELLAAADAGLHVLADLPLFKYGVSPNKLFDSMAAGLPVLTNAGGEVGELVAGHGAGLAVAPDGLAAGARALLAATPDQRAAWGAAGRRFIAGERSRDLLARRLRELLDELAPT